MRPHTVQIITIYRLLCLETGHSVRQWLADKCSWLSGQERHRNHMAQILTGAGKSITLGLLAATLAALGVGTDIVCYSSYLTRRDEVKMRPFFNYLEVPTDLIRYFTFEQLCASRLSGVGTVAKKLVEAGTVDAADAERIKPDKGAESGRVLLIDEVDVFFTKRFFGATFDAGFTLRSANITKFIRAVYEKRGDTTRDPTTLPEFAAVLKEFHADTHELLKAIAKRCAEGANSFKLRDFKLLSTGANPPVLVYKRGDQHEPLVYPNETMFAYLSRAELTDSVKDAHLGFDCHFGQFSFAEIPRWYKSILGVSGTVEQLSAEERRILRDEFGVETYTYAPSVFGTSKLNGGGGFSHDTHTIFHKTQKDWIGAIEKRAFDAAEKNNRAVLIFCKNEATLEKLRQSSDRFKRCEVLSEGTPVEMRPAVIADAVHKGRVTLCTRAFGRGVDFACTDPSVTVTCIATFLPSTASEQVQIMGRTARQGQAGYFYMELCNEHLMRKFFPAEVETAADEAAALEAVGAIISAAQAAAQANGKRSALLNARQAAKSATKTKDHIGRLKSARVHDGKSWQTVLLLADPSAPTERKLKAVCGASLESISRPTLYITVLDASGSMGTYWAMLKTAFDGFMTELKTHASDGQTQIAVVPFGCSAKTVYEGALGNITLPASTSAAGVGGSTNYGAAFVEVERLVNDPKYRNHAKAIVFFTDGYPTNADHTAICERILNAKASDICSLFCIYFSPGNQNAAPAVVSLENQFKQRQISTQLLTPQNKAQLESTMKQAAHSGGPMFHVA